jgi:hypothetical protein
MPTPFPGMDPYLERSGLWKEVHAGLIVAIQQHLSALLRPRYRVAIERRTYLALLEPDSFAGKPDILVLAADPPHGAPAPGASTQATTLSAELPMPDDVIERYLEVRDTSTGAVVTVIEILSPTYKFLGDGRVSYERKRLRVLASATHLIEIDLLRAGPLLPMRLPSGASSDYRIVVSRAPQRPHAQVFLFGVRDPIPDVPVPLHANVPEPVLPLNQILHELYDRAGYDLAIDYRGPAEPPLPPADVAWIETRLP